MKIFLIVGDNGAANEDYRDWNVIAFEKKEEAEAYILRLHKSIETYLKGYEEWKRLHEHQANWDVHISERNIPRYPENELDKKVTIFSNVFYEIEEIEFIPYHLHL